MICVFILRRELPKAQPKVVLWRCRESNLMSAAIDPLMKDNVGILYPLIMISFVYC